MELEVIRAFDAGLRDATIGINAMIAALVIDKVGDLVPIAVTVYNYADHAWVARKKINKEEVESGDIALPAVAVYLEAPPVFGPMVRTTFRDGDFPIALSYLSAEPDDAKRMRDALYVNRAMLRFLSRFDADANAAMRNRNGVNVYVSKSLTQYTPFDSWEAAILSASTLATYQCRDHLP